MSSFGILGLLPFILMIFFLLWQRDVIFPIIGGLIIGSILLSRFNPLLGLFHTAGDLVGAAFSERGTVLVLILLGETLVFFSLLNQSGYIQGFTRKLAHKKLTKDILQAVVLASGIIVCINRYLAVMLVGLFSRPFAERKNLSPLKHAYILNTSTSAASTLIPLTTITPLIVMVIGTTFEGLGIEYSPVTALYKSLPYQFYSIFALFIAITTVVLKKDAFLMAKGNYRDSGPPLHFGIDVEKPKKNPKSMFYGVPASLLVVFTGILLSILFEEKLPIVTAAEKTVRVQLTLINALFSGIIFTILLLLLTKSVSYQQLKPAKSFIGKIPLMTILYILLTMSAHALAKKIGFQSSIIGLIFKGTTPVVIIPLTVFLLSGAFSFLSGSSVLTITAMIPLALKLLSRSLPDPHLVSDLTFATIAAVLSGAGFGDNNSPLSITFILSTAVTKSSVNGHFNTQVIYSSLAVGVSVVFGYVLLIAGARPSLSLTAGFLVIAGTFILINGQNPFKTKAG